MGRGYVGRLGLEEVLLGLEEYLDLVVSLALVENLEISNLSYLAFS